MSTRATTDIGVGRTAVGGKTVAAMLRFLRRQGCATSLSRRTHNSRSTTPHQNTRPPFLSWSSSSSATWNKNHRISSFVPPVSDSSKTSRLSLRQPCLDMSPQMPARVRLVRGPHARPGTGVTASAMRSQRAHVVPVERCRRLVVAVALSKQVGAISPSVSTSFRACQATGRGSAPVEQRSSENASNYTVAERAPTCQSGTF